jgi:glycosyltransferase involved in cell wall biosynthesis
MTTTVIAPDLGGVSYVARRVSDGLDDTSAIYIGSDGSVSSASCQCRPVRPTLRGSRPVAGRALRAVWTHRRCLLRSSSIHLELGRTAVGPFWFGLGAALLSRRRLVSVLHDGPIVVRNPGAAVFFTGRRWQSAIAYRLFAPLLNRTLVAMLRRRTTSTLTLGDQASRSARQAGWPQVRRVWLGADVARADSPSPAEADYVLLAGYLGPGKGLDVLADAWAKAHPRLRLIIAGAPAADQAEWVGAVRARFATGPCPPTWLGYVAEDEFARLIAAAAVVVVPYEVSNPASGILVRALVEGRAVIASDVAAAAGELLDGVNGLVVPPGDPVALAQALMALDESPELRASLGRSAAAHAAIRHTWTRHLSAVRASHRLAPR